MPALAFGLKPNKPPLTASKPPLKRKALFNNDQDDNEDEDNAFGKLAASKPAVKTNLNAGPPHKSTKVSDTQSTNLSALRSAKLHDAAASQLDSTIYDYDGVYDSFQAVKNKPATNGDPEKPKYMTSLLQSAEVRKRDQLRAKEKLLQRERENEGDEFADKEAFVTSAYKKQQEENRLLEEAEKKREEDEEERRRKGGGMLEFNRKMLAREEERSRDMGMALEEAKKRTVSELNGAPDEPETMDENKEAAKLNEKGAKVVVNDDGEVVDKRQLLGAGLNVAPTKKTADTILAGKKTTDKPTEWHRSAKAQDARLSQRERQSRMMERQIEEMAEKQRAADEAEKKAAGEKNKSKLTEDAKMGAKERFLQRKKEREEQAKKAKANG